MLQDRRKSVAKNEDELRIKEALRPEDDPDHNIMQVKFADHLVYTDYVVADPVD